MPSPWDEIYARLNTLEQKIEMILRCLHDMADHGECGCCTDRLRMSLQGVVKKDLGDE